MSETSHKSTPSRKKMQLAAYGSLMKTPQVSFLFKVLDKLFLLCVFLALVISLTSGWYGYALITAVFAILYEIRHLFK